MEEMIPKFGRLRSQIRLTLIAIFLLSIPPRACSRGTLDANDADSSLADASIRPDGACSTPRQSIIVQGNVLDQRNCMLEDEALLVDFHVVPAYEHHYCPWSATLFNGGAAVGSCTEFGRCQLRVEGASLHPTTNIMLVISSPPGAFSQDQANFCFEDGNSEHGCEDIISMYRLTVNMRHPEYLAPALSLDAVGFVTGSEVGPRRYALANEYDIDDGASFLIDPIASPDCTEITIVSPLRAQDDLTKNFTAW
jgi:hypothetical protein